MLLWMWIWDEQLKGGKIDNYNLTIYFEKLLYFQFENLSSQ